MARQTKTIAINITKPLLILLALIALTLALAQTLRAADLHIKATFTPDSLTVGDRFLYTNTVALQPGVTLEPVPIEEGKLGEAMAFSPIRKLDKSTAGTVSYACTLAVYQPGKVTLPTFSFKRSSDNAILAGDSITVNIRTVLPLDTTGLQIADIRPPRKLRGPIWPYLVILLAIALIVAAVAFLRRRMRGKIIESVIPPIPAWELAYQKLDALKAERYGEFGKFKQFYFELSLIIREYIEGRYHTPAVESTTYELEQNNILHEMPIESYGHLFDFFNRADLVKFAKSIPTPKDAEADLAFGYSFVDSTKPAPAPVVETWPQPEVKS
jgi:hypothetical protein